MKLVLSACLALCLSASVSGQWCWWCFPICDYDAVYFVPSDSSVADGEACAAAAANATLSYGSYKHDQTILQANQPFGVCSCDQVTCPDHRANSSSVSFADCRFCSGVGKAIVVPDSVTCH